jgi:hypothetical protein
MAAMYGGGGGKAARAEKKENKKVAKEAAKTVKSVTKSMAKPAKQKPISLKERADKMAAAKGLAKLDVLEIPLKRSARKEMFRNQRQGK